MSARRRAAARALVVAASWTLLLPLGGCPRWVLRPHDAATDVTLPDSPSPSDTAAIDGSPDTPLDAPSSDALTDAAPADAGCADDATDPVCTRQIAELALGARHSCARRRDGQVMCWGANDHGQLGNGTTTDRGAPDLVTMTGGAPLTAIVQIAMGENYGCARRAEGTVWCWGANGRHQIGAGVGGTADVTRAIMIAGVASARWLATARESACVLTPSGVQCWGAAGAGQLGDGTTSDRTTPGPPALVAAGASRVTGGWQHLCALADTGAVQCWGDNGWWQVQGGAGVRTQYDTPVLVTAVVGATALSLGYLHSSALMPDGSVRCWGGNSMGELGAGSTAEFTREPGAVQDTTGGTLAGARAVALGGLMNDADHSCALMDDGSVRCWGANHYGQLGATSAESCRGLGTTPRPCSTRAQPVAGLAGRAQQIALGGAHSCALMEADGGVYCWGLNADGQLGRDATSTHMSGTPLRVAFP